MSNDSFETGLRTAQSSRYEDCLRTCSVFDSLLRSKVPPPLRYLFLAKGIVGQGADVRLQARRISKNRLEGMDDDDGVVSWDLPNLGSEWEKRVKDSIPKIEEDEMSLLYQIKDDIRDMVDQGNSTSSS